MKGRFLASGMFSFEEFSPNIRDFGKS
ncbi:Protein of unknown function [Pyronema omphalodes CBS 100304]|uniref:Uncharacterized protein n=1 Tax=Pyronema omphalodes (strain CBS 100304) TaxID=1076935 RepID=U4LCE5_PYROM|nr:Protein of unknown function [Pyronema omphalodes CBS 100304]